MEVQQAFSEGRLKIQLADKVHRQSKQAQARIASEIRTGGDPNEIVGRHLQKTTAKPAVLGRRFGKLIDELNAALETFKGREHEIHRSIDQLSRDSDVLRRFLAYFRSLPTVLELRKSEQIATQKAIRLETVKVSEQLRKDHDRFRHGHAGGC
jgi:hypothetical protein